MTTPDWLDRSGWPYTPRWMAAPEGRLHYVAEGPEQVVDAPEGGTGETVVLVHGTPTWSYEWRHVIAGLKDTHKVIAVDHLGFGLSERPTTAGYTPEDHARRFAVFMEHVVPAGPVTLVVHDFGGPIALAWALDHPERLARVVIVNTWLWSFEDDPTMRRRAAMVSGAVGRWLYRRFNASLRLIMPSAYGDRRRLTAAIHRQYLAVFPDPDSRERVLFALAQSLLGSSAFFDRLWQRREQLRGTPLSLFWGMRDSAFSPQVLERWQRAFPHARTVAFPSSGHWPHEEEPQAFVRALRLT